MEYPDIELSCSEKYASGFFARIVALAHHGHASLLAPRPWQESPNQTLEEEILMSDVELSEIEDEIREIRELLDDENRLCHVSPVAEC